MTGEGEFCYTSHALQRKRSRRKIYHERFKEVIMRIHHIEIPFRYPHITLAFDRNINTLRCQHSRLL